jgi:hypothetical protein
MKKRGKPASKEGIFLRENTLVTLFRGWMSTIREVHHNGMGMPRHRPVKSNVADVL